jgi:hypothetical protein
MLMQCSGTTKAGARCRARALPGSDRCISHDPTRQAELAEWRRRMRKVPATDGLGGEEIQVLMSKALREALAQLDVLVRRGQYGLSPAPTSLAVS